MADADPRAVEGFHNARYLGMRYILFTTVYINIVLRINPTAMPSISKGSPGWTTMGR